MPRGKAEWQNMTHLILMSQEFLPETKTRMLKVGTHSEMEVKMYVLKTHT